ncbi:MAG: hypothetical protein WDW38_011613 [Sanguina aurantia]
MLSPKKIVPCPTQGPLWEWMRTLNEAGFVTDSGYTTSFRVPCKGGKSASDIAATECSAPKQLKMSFNLGHADFYPVTSGKLSAARHVMRRFMALEEDCTFLCDDDNDLELAAVVSKAFLPSVTSPSVEAAIQLRPDHFVRAAASGTQATEEMLDAVLQHYSLKTKGNGLVTACVAS